MTPFRAMVEDALKRSRKHSLLLIHSNRTPEEAPFLDQWSQESLRFDYRPTITPADVAGPERFVKGVIEALKDLKVDEDQLRFEEFPGY